MPYTQDDSVGTVAGTSDNSEAECKHPLAVAGTSHMFQPFDEAHPMRGEFNVVEAPEVVTSKAGATEPKKEAGATEAKKKKAGATKAKKKEAGAAEWLSRATEAKTDAKSLTRSASLNRKRKIDDMQEEYSTEHYEKGLKQVDRLKAELVQLKLKGSTAFSAVAAP